MEAETQRRNSYLEGALDLLPMALAVAVYLNSLNGQPILDDGWAIFANPLIKHLDRIRGMFTDLYGAVGSGVYRPITSLSYAINYALGGSRVFGFHAGNLLLHALCTGLVLDLGQWLAPRFGLPHPRAMPRIAAAVFALHPVHVEAVTSMTGRPELLGAFFALGAVRLGLIGRAWSAALAGGCVALGVLSKENAAMAPALLALVVVCAGRPVDQKPRPSWRNVFDRRVVAAGAAMAAGIALYPLLRHLLTHSLGVKSGDTWFAGQPQGVVFNTMTRVMAENLQLLVFPHPLGCDFYYAMKFPMTLEFGWPSAGSTLAWVSVLVSAFALFRRWPLWTLGVLWVFTALLPVMNLIPIGALIAERHLYLPSAGFCWVVGGLAVEAWARLRSPARLGAAAAAGVGVLALLAAKTWVRNLDWRDATTFWEAEVVKEPLDPVVNNNLGLEYMNSGKLAQAQRQLEVGLSHSPWYWRSHVNLGLVKHRLGDDAGAMASYQRAREIAPNESSPDLLAGSLLLDERKPEEALPYLQRAVAHGPLVSDNHVWLAQGYLQLGRRPEAIAELRRVIDLDPGDYKSRELMVRLGAPL